MNKVCIICNIEKENDMFAKDSHHTNGTKNTCKSCAAKRKKKYYDEHRAISLLAAKRYRDNNKEKIAQSKKQWSQSDKGKKHIAEYCKRPEVRKRFQFQQWKRKYGLAIREAELLLTHQQSKCAVCGVELQSPYLDHCHQTGTIRGFLCLNCNIGLGAFRDNPKFLIEAARYLEKNGNFEVENRRILLNGKVV
jgi:hypothetical protein